MTLSISLKELTLVGFHDFVHEDMDGQLRHVFYSLHTPQMEPLYVSETVFTTSTLSFGKVTLPRLPSQLFHVVVKLWYKTETQDSWILYYEAVVDLRRLVMLRKPFRELDDESLIENSIVWCFDEKEYTLPENVRDKRVMQSDRRTSVTRGRNVPKQSYTMDDIRHLTSLDTGIKELTLSNIKLSQQIDGVLDSIKGKVSQHDPEVSRALKFRIHNLHRYINKQRNNNDTLSSKVYERKVLIGNLNRALEDHFPPFKDLCEGQLEYVTSQIDPIHESLSAAIYPELIVSLKAVGGVIAEAFHIEPRTGAGKFSILGTEFPSSTKDLLEVCYNPTKQLHSESEEYSHAELPTTIDKVNAGLSYIVATMLILADILGVSLNYTMKYFGSRSTLVDHLSAPSGGNSKSVKVIYPLYFDVRHTEKTTDRAGRKQLKNLKFEQGLYLLNRNLVTLMSAASNLYLQLYHDGKIHLTMPSESVDNLLWNLKSLLLFMTASYKAQEASDT
ncbi:hypothetical protein FT663_01273 [Candidozyma haemuli var. vulneris]|uniref:Uncharacterized protein n=1 Tax=Candidozyma haemuli TaxID=45357 RepID=A0A2V1AX43_9ASCO|nr:hypothetical protein CXQ85_004950 [[Candida] haemuloni]KAF3992138.1 hypothetical protein FT662_01308 [[Candida] haemuloni var. vulneris]KAF3994583.1 hypothetical protein FT663_01273 [[Candida] haemuloni var. vulneris]PVH22382.1 hypothetical protein CXQ85_004950 [[Candida] haemuloni]